MKNIIRKSWAIILISLLLSMVVACGDKEKKQEESAPVISETPNAVNDQPVVAGEQVPAGDIAVSVDGKTLKKADLEKNIKETLKRFKDKVPADKQKELRENIKNQLVNTFVMRTLLVNEIEKRNIQASPEEVKRAMDSLKSQLPPNKKIEEFFKENGISKEDVILSVKVEKYRNMEIGNKAKPSKQEINKFYNDNRDKLFTEPESVHVRHILVATKNEDDEKVKAQKKEKIEGLRKQLLSGSDFAEIARNNSDCPSKEKGGDLNFIKRGQTVKAFEDAAFSQEKNAVGPVITTEFGYHIIQVLDRKQAKKVALEDVREKISSYLEQQKKVEIFNDVLKKLQSKAKIMVY
jgi:peptidyl-prolyl cis-trans isomerase C